MTNDTDALTERMAEEMYYSEYPETRHRNEWPDAVFPDAVYEYRDLAAAVLPIVAEEVRKAAKAAWDDAIDEALDGWTVPASGDLEAVRFILLSSNPYMPKEGA